MHSSKFEHDFRVAVGSASGRRSTIWKFFVRNHDVYIVSGMCEGDCKITLHPSGDCQFSAVDAWVKKVAGRRNADRHMVKWHSPRPTGSAATEVLQIRIPESELREIDTTEDLSEVHWLPAPGAGKCVAFGCYLTCPNDSDPVIGASLPCDVLFYSQLADKRWLVVFNFLIEYSQRDIDATRRQIIDTVAQHGLQVLSEHRAIAHLKIDGASFPGFIEFCPVPDVRA
jgi:hypothetical protein